MTVIEKGMERTWQDGIKDGLGGLFGGNKD